MAWMILITLLPINQFSRRNSLSQRKIPKIFRTVITNPFPRKRSSITTPIMIDNIIEGDLTRFNRSTNVVRKRRALIFPSVINFSPTSMCTRRRNMHIFRRTERNRGTLIRIKAIGNQDLRKDTIYSA
jgi:hypothetical protein